MGTINVSPDKYSEEIVTNIGYPKKTVIGTFDFDSSYTAGGEGFDLSEYFSQETLGVLFENINGYIFKYDTDNKKVKAFSADILNNSSAGQTYTVVDTDSPGGNTVYIAFDNAGKPYLECNMANDTADKYLDFGNGIKAKIYHNGTPGGQQVYFDEDGAQPDRLLADLSGSVGANVYIETNIPGYYLKVVNDSSASSNGVAVNYDDGTDEQLEATTNSNTNANIDLATNKIAEVETGTDLSALTDIRFHAFGY